MDGLGDDQAIIAKARAAGPPPESVWQQLDRSPISDFAPQSWREAARSVVIKPRDAQPKIRDFERSLLPTLRTLRAQFVCDICPHCSRPVIRSVLADHVAECEKRDRSTISTRATNGVIATSKAASPAVKAEDHDVESRLKKKRKADPNSEIETAAGPKKAKVSTSTTAKAPKSVKAKPAAKPKQTRQTRQPKEKSQPVFNADKNCGVGLPNGQPCMRSLTCKAHSMAQKRAVQGRSAPYDAMLSNYQRQHQARQQQQLSAVEAAQADSEQQLEAQAQLNPEREVQQVMEGMARVFCPPLDRKVIVHSQARSKNMRLREMLALALLPRRLAPTGDALFGRSLVFRPEAPEILSPVRAPAVQQAIYLAQAQQLKLQQLRQQEASQASQASQAAPGAHARPSGSPDTQNGSRTAGNHMSARAQSRFPS